MHTVTDGLGNPLRFLLSGGNRHDICMAQELLEVSAARQMEKGFAFSEDTVWQKEFEESFPYSETDDQLRCIEEIKQDFYEIETASVETLLNL